MYLLIRNSLQKHCEDLHSKGLPFLGQVALTTGPQEFLVRMCLNIALPLSMSVSVFE